MRVNWGQQPIYLHNCAEFWWLREGAERMGHKRELKFPIEVELLYMTVPTVAAKFNAEKGGGVVKG
jgi:hypothetical protein